MPLLSLVVGARPNFVKAAPVLAECRRRGELDTQMVHTGQHYDKTMSAAFFRDLALPEPDIWLQIGSGSHATQTADAMKGLEHCFERDRPDMVVVFGDVNSTLSAALTAAKLKIPVAHVESGLRSFDRTMPEEINRVLTDHICDLLFVTEQSGVVNLTREGVSGDHVLLVGNTMIDSLEKLLPIARSLAPPVRARFGVESGKYAVLTMHRPSNVDDATELASMINALGELETPIVFPVHPRTSQRLDREPPPNFVVVPPMGYVEFLALLDAAGVVLTDSGGIQEEATALGIPCVTIRENTERPVTTELGTNTLAGTVPERVLACARMGLERGRLKRRAVPLWDGKAAERIVDAIEAYFEKPANVRRSQ